MAKLEGEGLTTVGHEFGEMTGGGADRDPVQGQALSKKYFQGPPLFDVGYKTNEGHKTVKEAIDTAQNNPTLEGQWRPDPDSKGEAKDQGKKQMD